MRCYRDEILKSFSDLQCSLQNHLILDEIKSQISELTNTIEKLNEIITSFHQFTCKTNSDNYLYNISNLNLSDFLKYKYKSCLNINVNSDSD